MKNNDLVSIIMPSFNRETLIVESINSVINQTYKNIEVLIVDDGSTDSTVDKIKNLMSKDERIKILFRGKREKGAASCRNIGIEKSNGKYLMFLDSDDKLAPICIEKRIQNIQDYDFVVHQSKLFEKSIENANRIYNDFKKNKDPIVRFLREDYPWNISSFLVRKNYILDNGIRFWEKIDVHHDIQVSLQLLVAGGRYIMLDIVDVFIRVGNKDKMTNKLSHCSTIKKRIAFYLAIKELLVGYEKEIENGLISVFYDALLYRCYKLLYDKEFYRHIEFKRCVKIIVIAYIIFLQRYRRQYNFGENILNRIRLITKIKVNEDEILPDKSTMG